ncbi:FdhF/YdeP family oxidoreductase [Luteolibacter pohnpeiensis]|uniref:FdhF/YdeP family oxidoreductase n=1 Tax=Luteolibacter pohnpeiensis TaxID=454153 RepID=A0A934SDS3_9BACT|nr:FdhF/YdeP family oxidoreductase [Luteolibacter pohnpeiensis]MBK1883368.1 FdhF/YdeP family oxidoreductase [Luteolibacter pohnpeiensis]
MSGEEHLKQGKPKTWAAGAPAVAVSMEHMFREAGALRGPVGLAEMNQFGGFDCPSCAWPDPDHDRSIAEFCENGAKAFASEATTKRVDAKFFAKHSVTELAKQSGWWHEQQGRITEPMILRAGASHYEPISWDDAFRTIADQLKALDSPNQAIFYTSGRASNEAAFLYQLFARSYGTNNLPDCSNMCHESSGLALKQSIGEGKGTVTLDDFLKADVILCVGQNPGTNHPRMLSTLEKAVEGGTKLVAVNPLREAGLMGFAHPQKVAGMLGRPTRLASKYLQIRINGDLALFRGLAKALLEFEENTPGSVVDDDFIKSHTIHYEEYRSLAVGTGWAEIVRLSGIDESEIRDLALDLCNGSRKLITCWAMGLTQHRNSVATIREVVNVHLLLGAIGRDGAGVCPVRGHSNVQGDRTVGIWEKMPESFLSSLDRECGIHAPRDHGYDTVASIHAMHRGEAKVFFGLGGNFLQAAPDTDYTAAALEQCELTCHVSTKLNRSHLVTGKTALILPCLGRSERDGEKNFVTCENSMGVVQLSRGILAPLSPDLRSEVAIIAGIAAAFFDAKHPVPWLWLAEDYDRIRSLIERVVPGFEDYNFRVTRQGGFYLPNSAKERDWKTPEQKAVFSTAEMDSFAVKPGRLILQTLRSHDQFNTTIYGMNDRYRGIGHARKVILVNPEELRERGIRPGSKVDITSICGDERRIVRDFSAVPYEMPRGSAAAYFPEANVLVPISAQAKGSGTPTSKSVEIEIAQSV